MTNVPHFSSRERERWMGGVHVLAKVIEACLATTCSAMIGHLFDIIIEAATDNNL